MLSKNIEPAFIRDGFNNWKKALQRFDVQQRSAGHKEAIFKFSRRVAPGINVRNKKITTNEKVVFKATVISENVIATGTSNKRS